MKMMQCVVQMLVEARLKKMTKQLCHLEVAKRSYIEMLQLQMLVAARLKKMTEQLRHWKVV
jgi:hypothetical protein